MAADNLTATSRSEAKRLGLKIYHTGNPCPAGHVTGRYTVTGSCVECLSIRSKSAHKKQYDKAYYRAHKERIAKRSKRYYEKNSARHMENSRSWVARNPEKRRFIAMSYKARRRAQEAKGASYSELQEWTKAQKKICYWCGARCVRKFHIDHYEPLSKGGKHEIANLVISCAPCNQKKSAKDPYDFAAEVGRLF